MNVMFAYPKGVMTNTWMGHLIMGYAFIFIALLLATQTAIAEGFYVDAGYDFRPGSSDMLFGFQGKHLAIEADIFSMGKEEPNTKPGQEYSLNVLAFIPSQPIFIKAGIVSGESNKHGYDFGIGADYVLSRDWAIRGQATHYKVVEDLDGAFESENIFSVGLKYQF